MLFPENPWESVPFQVKLFNCEESQSILMHHIPLWVRIPIIKRDDLFDPKLTIPFGCGNLNGAGRKVNGEGSCYMWLMNLLGEQEPFIKSCCTCLGNIYTRPSILLLLHLLPLSFLSLSLSLFISFFLSFSLFLHQFDFVFVAVAVGLWFIYSVPKSISNRVHFKCGSFLTWYLTHSEHRHGKIVVFIENNKIC